MAMDHSSCEHPRTPAGRAWCRKNGGPGSGAVWGSLPDDEPTMVAARNPQAARKAAKAVSDTPTTKRASKARTVDLSDLPRMFTATVDWANAHGCTVATRAIGDQSLVDITNDRGVLTLTWRPTTPEGVNAVAFRPAGTSVTKKLTTVNEGLALLRG